MVGASGRIVRVFQALPSQWSQMFASDKEKPSASGVSAPIAFKCAAMGTPIRPKSAGPVR
jgi:hypothetical protein